MQEPQQRILGNQRAHWMQPGPTVNADGGQEPKPDAELVEQPVAGLGQVGPQAPELRPGQHRCTLWHPDPGRQGWAAAGRASPDRQHLV